MKSNNVEEIKGELKNLLEKRKTIDENTSEANIEATLISQLFTLLGWNFLDPSVYDRNSYVRGAGYPDVALKIDNDPVIFVEVKKIGRIPTNRIDPQAQMTLPLKELADLIDRTPEEKQAFKYARGKEIDWAILTNFDCLFVYNANQEQIVLSFKTPEEYLARFDDLLWLSREKVKAGSLEWLQNQLRKEEIDKGFLEKLKNWRVTLAQNIYGENGDNHILKDDKGEFDLEKLMGIVQRVLSRLMIIQIADDREVLKKHDLLENLIKTYENLGDYATKDHLLKKFIDLSEMMDQHHNTTIFTPGHPCDKVFISNGVLDKTIKELCHVSFRKMTADILGATYESYLGYRFSLKNGRIEAEVDQRVRKQGGIYYTPSYIVRYIVDNTLGVKLKELEDQYGLEAGEKAKDLKILDPACGSGSFLIYAFDVLAGFYERLNAKITEKQVELSRINSNSDMFERQEQFKHLPPRVGDYPKRILEDHLYGVDLDPAACEIATINLVIKAFEKMRDKKLPLILNQNVKVGNSLISGVEKKEDLDKFKSEITQHIELRTRLKQTEDDEEKRELMKQIDQLREKVNLELNESLNKYFDKPEEKKPFNWEFEFPEVFDSEKSEEQKGFDVVMGNPPYIGFQGFTEDKAILKSMFYTAVGRFDIYIPFIERGLQELKNYGLLSFICPTNFSKRQHGVNLRALLLNNIIIRFVDFQDVQIFAEALNYTGIIVVQKGEPSGKENVYYVPQGINAVGFLYPQKSLSKSGWVFRDLEHEKIVDKIDSQKVTSLKSVSDGIAEGIITGDNETFLLTEETITQIGIEKGILKKCVRGEDINKWLPDWNGYFIIYPYLLKDNEPSLLSEIDLKRKYPNAFQYLKSRKTWLAGRSYFSKSTKKWYELWCQRDIKRQSRIKIVVRELADTNRFALVEKDTLYIDTTCGITLKDQIPEHLYYILAVLNSILVEYYYKKTTVPKAGGFFIYKTMYLNNIPIRRIDFSNSREKEMHDKLVECVDTTIVRNKLKIELLKIFEQVLKNHTHELQPFGKAYYEKPEYVEKMDKKAKSIASSTDEVSKIFLEEKGKTLVFSALLNGEKREALRVKVDNENFRLFLFYALRKYLEENKRRKKWTTKSFPKILDVLLGRLEVPAFKTKTKLYDPDNNLRMIDLVMKEFKTEFFKEFTKGNLHLTRIEEEIQDTDNSIDALVFKLYDLDKEEVTTVLDSMETPEIIKKDILKKFEEME